MEMSLSTLPHMRGGGGGGGGRKVRQKRIKKIEGTERKWEGTE